MEKAWKGKAAKYEIEEEIYEDSQSNEEEAGKQFSKLVTDMEDTFGERTPLERTELIKDFVANLVMIAKKVHSQLVSIIESVKPNVIIEDYMVPVPAFLTSNVPLVKLYSIAPLYICDDRRLPPFGCGLPLNDSSEWDKHREVICQRKSSYAQLMNEWLDKEYPQLPKFSNDKLYQSTNLNIYLYPSAAMIDYWRLCPLSEEYINVDHCLRPPFGEFEVPEKFRKHPGKLIFLSLGTIGSAMVRIMKRLVTILAKSKHKFIVAMGHGHKEYELAENMWGEQFVPQLAVLPHVDLALIHGGNNSFTETLYFGKPMIFLPLYGDQLDNAQRAVEMKIGLKCDRFRVTEHELNTAIEQILSDATITERVKRISSEIQASRSLQNAVEKIEYVAKHPKFPTII